MRVGHYEVEGQLGEGGMGVVYRARDPLGRHVALKRLSTLSALGTQELERFRREAAAVARLNHPNIVRVHSLGEHQGVPHFAMDLVEGMSLAAHLKRGPLPASEAVAIAEALAHALEHAHGLGILHRDVKPANVLLRAEDGAPLLTDFGLAKDLTDTRERLTCTGQMLGTPSFMSPEQASGELKRAGPATDVYGLGATLYALLAGRPPFVGASTINILKSVLSDMPEAPSVHSPGVSPDLDAICLKCLAKAPADRYGSASELAEDLARLRQGRPVKAPTQGGSSGLLLALGALTAVLVVGLSGLFLTRGGEAHPKARELTPPPTTASTTTRTRTAAAAWDPRPERLQIRKAGNRLLQADGRAVAFPRDDLVAAGGYKKGGVRLWQRTSEGTWHAVALLHEERGFTVLLASQDTERLLLGSGRKTFVHSTAPGFELLFTLGTKAGEPVLDLALSPTAPRLLAIATGHGVELHDLETKACLWAYPAEGEKNRLMELGLSPHSVSFSASGEEILVGWGTTTREGGIAIKAGCFLLSREGELLASREGTSKDLDLRSRPNELVAAAEGWWAAMNDGQILRIGVDMSVTQSLVDKRLHPSGTDSAQTFMKQAAHPASVRGLARSQQGFLVSVSGHNRPERKAAHLHLWSARGSPLTCKTHPQAEKTTFYALALSPNGRWLATMAQDLDDKDGHTCGVELWELREQ